MTIDREPDSIVELGADWLIKHRDQIDSGVIPTIKTRFGVSTLTAIEIVRAAAVARGLHVYRGDDRDG